MKCNSNDESLENRTPESQPPKPDRHVDMANGDVEATALSQPGGESARSQEQNSESPQEPAMSPPATSPGDPDPFDLDALWATVPLEATTTKVLAVRGSPRAPKDKFIRVHPFRMPESGKSNEYVNCRSVYLFEHQYEGELTAKTFYIPPNTEVFARLSDAGRLKLALVVMGIVRNGSVFIWELKLPAGENETADRWACSRLQVAELAQREWLKPRPNTSAGGYDVQSPYVDYDEPEWPISFEDAIKAACKDRVITSMDHEAVKEALGL